jgi:hypothetical protein
MFTYLKTTPPPEDSVVELLSGSLYGWLHAGRVVRTEPSEEFPVCSVRTVTGHLSTTLDGTVSWISSGGSSEHNAIVLSNVGHCASQNFTFTTGQQVAIPLNLNVTVRTFAGIRINQVNPINQVEACVFSSWFSSYQKWRDYEWVDAASCFLKAYKEASFRSWTEAANLFVRICGRAERAALMLGRMIERLFHARLIEHRILQTLVGS